MPIRLTNRKLKKLAKDTQQSAEAIDLLYVSDKEEGIRREKKDKGFVYRWKGKKVTDKAVLARIQSLVLPPAWEEVWICHQKNGHLQATGKDTLGRKQYKYHPLWSQLRNHTKFSQLQELGQALPKIRERLNHDLSKSKLNREKVLAAVVSILLRTGIRMGSQEYEKLYGSFGITTLKDKHAKINGSELRFTFKGKKGVRQDLSLKSRRLARIVQQCRDIPGQELFQYYDAAGERMAIDSGDVNEYIKEISGGAFTAKDFRTWTGTVAALKALHELGCTQEQKEAKHRIVQALDRVSEVLGNTRTVCKKYYVHPVLLHLYECEKLQQYLDKMEAGRTPVKGLYSEEEVLLKILEDNGASVIS